MLDIRQIMEVMPHRYPFLLIDRILEVESDRIRAIKNVTFNEPFFIGHFPEHPVMPGVLLVEAMAQAGGFLLFREVEDRDNKLIYFTGIDSCRFRRPVVPGDQVVFDVTVLSNRRSFAKLDATATVDGEVVCSAGLLSAMVDR
jgi:3-hydroxyacyl-[acyl-carrier-protein] dehydratase